MNRIIITTLLFVLAYSQFGYYFEMLYVQHTIKRAMKTKILGSLKTEDTEIISYTDQKDKIEWEEEGEFSFRGEMYDVVRRTVENGKILLYCLNDKKEQELLAEYSAVTKQNTTDTKRTKMFTFSISLFFESFQEPFISHSLQMSNVFPGFASTLFSVSLPKISPPPKTRFS